MANVILVGMMGSGKSTIAKALKSVINYEFVDCDLAIEANEQMVIKDIFNHHGELYFRALEKQYLLDFNQDHCIISTGGGMVIQDVNRSRMKSIGHVIYLKGSISTLYNRLMYATEDRPLLKSSELLEKITMLLNDREAMYCDACHTVINIDDKSVEEVCKEIYVSLKEIGYIF